VRYLSIFFEIKDLDRTNPAFSEEGCGVKPSLQKKMQAVKVRSVPLRRDFKLSVSLTGTESFFTESLILAQNERWRRG
jgi:hypothetical protein